mgnify:CR=1 FL=1
MSGTPNFSGIIWTNEFDGNGNITINIPDSDLASVCDLMKFCGSNDALYESFTVDYVTRAVRSLSFF